MRKKIVYIMLLLCSMFLLQGCRQVNLNVEGKIQAPQLKQSPLQGTWKINNYTEGSGVFSSAKDNFVGKTAVFDKNIAVLGNEVCELPQYKLKSVSSDEFMIYRYKTSAKNLGINKEKVDVISITSEQQSFHDFIKIDDNTVMVYIDYGFLYLSKVSDRVDEAMKQIGKSSESKENKTMASKSDSMLRSGVLLGLRSQKTTKENEKVSSYRTLWIAVKNKELNPVFEVNQLFVPRKSGFFWEVGYEPQDKDGKQKNMLFAQAVIDNSKVYSNSEESNFLQEYGRRDIVFVGNDYIGTEYYSPEAKEEKKPPRYQVLPIDNIRSGKGVNISDIAGEIGNNVLMKSSQAFILSKEKSDAAGLEKSPAEDNFSLVRRNGRWIMQGRLNYVSGKERNSYEDFSIYLPPVPALINFDNLYLSWNQIKAKVPEALDAYTSPNKDLVLIITRGFIEVYGVNNEVMTERPLSRINLKEDECVVMAEWARGDYMEKWGDIIEKRAVELSNNIK